MQKCNMTMFLIGTAILILCSYVGQIHCGSPMQQVSAGTHTEPPHLMQHVDVVSALRLLVQQNIHVNQSCGLSETECAFGCCPYADAVCCIDGFECCQHGQTCIPIIGICVGAVNNNGQVSLTSKKSTRVRSSVLKCPPAWTECGPDRCCRYEQGVCCSDGQHCCPNGYRCDVRDKKCIKEAGKWFDGAVGKPFRKLSGKSPYKSCPGGSRMCPGYMSCCVNDNGSWGCCPNPSLPQIGYGSGECCDTIFGHMCCPDDFPTCTIFGCTK